MKNKIGLFGNLRVLCFAALLAAFSAVFGKFLAISGDTWRVSIENLPIIFSGLCFGPVIGFAVGIVADLLGCVIKGYAINPLITLASAVIGIVPGIFMCILKKKNFVSVFISCFSAHLVGNIIVKTFILSYMYHQPLEVLFVWRSINYILIGCAESIIIYFLVKNKTVKDSLKRVGINDI